MHIIVHALGVKYSTRDLILTQISMRDPGSSSMRLLYQLNFIWIPFLNGLFVEICVKVSLILSFLFWMISITILSYTQTQWLMTSEIR